MCSIQYRCIAYCRRCGLRNLQRWWFWIGHKIITTKLQHFCPFEKYHIVGQSSTTTATTRLNMWSGHDTLQVTAKAKILYIFYFYLHSLYFYFLFCTALLVLSNLKLAQAQEIFVLKAMKHHMKESTVAQLTSSCQYSYERVLKG